MGHGNVLDVGYDRLGTLTCSAILHFEVSMPLFSDVMCTGFAPECCFHSLCRPKRAAERHAGEDYCKKKRSNPSYKALGVTIAFEQS